MTRFKEIAGPADLTALRQLISDDVWPRAIFQVEEQARQRVRAGRKAKKPNRDKHHATRPVSAKPRPHRGSRRRRAKVVSAAHPAPLPSSQPVLRPTHTGSFSQADLQGVRQATMAHGPVVQTSNSLISPLIVGF